MLGLFITKQEFEQFSSQGLVVDARRGGLVIGRSHDEGNIYMIQQYLTGYRVINHMEGGEYVICHEAIMKHKDRIENEDLSKYKAGTKNSRLFYFRISNVPDSFAPS